MNSKKYLYSFSEIWKTLLNLLNTISQSLNNAFKLTGDDISDSEIILFYNGLINSPIYYNLWKNGFEIHKLGDAIELSNSLVDIANGPEAEVILNNTQYSDEELILELLEIIPYKSSTLNPGGGQVGPKKG